MPTALKGRTGFLALSPGGVAEDDFTEMTNVQDLDLGLTKEAADATTRASGGWKQEVAVLKNCEISFSALWDPEDTSLEELRARWEDDGIVGVQCFDSSTGQGVQADMCVHDFTIAQPIAGIQTVSIRLKPAPSATAPEWFTPA